MADGLRMSFHMEASRGMVMESVGDASKLAEQSKG